MDPLKVFIIEDNTQETLRLQLQLEKNGYVVSGVACSLQEATARFMTTDTDIYIIDIYLQGSRGGIEFAEKMNAQATTRRPFLFLTSASDRSTFDLARKCGPFSYLLKPFNELELQYAIELAIEKFAKEVNGHFSAAAEPVSLFADGVFFIKKGNTLNKIEVSDIRYVEVDGKYCKLLYGEEKYCIQKSLKQLYDQLPARKFIKIHRNYIVNLKEIDRISLQDHEIILQDGSALAFSRRYLDALINQFGVLK
jgi:DNA-binding LytR/AlgR family response regulator